MGGVSWSDDTSRVISQAKVTKTQDQIFTAKTLKKEMNPFGVAFREARDSAANPLTTPVSVWLDETGSMGSVPESLVKGSLSALMNTMIKHKVSDPTIMFCGIGDHIYDRSPLQVGQYESGAVELDEWLSSIYLEGCGGGQDMESYLLAWLFAARHTSLDSFEKRGKKGFLFTIGDEATHECVEADDMKKILGYAEATDATAKQLLAEVERTHHVFHIHINQGRYKDNPRVFASWKNLLGERFIVLNDHNAVAETIATAVAVMNGADLSDVTSDMDSSKSNSVALALSNISKIVPNDSVSSGVMTL